MEHNPVLEKHLGGPLAVHRRELLLGLDLIVEDTQKLALLTPVFQVGEFVRTIFTGA
jgi:hypothetical protein